MDLSQDRFGGRFGGLFVVYEKEHRIFHRGAHYFDTSHVQIDVATDSSGGVHCI